MSKDTLGTNIKNNIQIVLQKSQSQLKVNRKRPTCEVVMAMGIWGYPLGALVGKSICTNQTKQNPNQNKQKHTHTKKHPQPTLNKPQPKEKKKGGGGEDALYSSNKTHQIFYIVSEALVKYEYQSSKQCLGIF